MYLAVLCSLLLLAIIKFGVCFLCYSTGEHIAATLSVRPSVSSSVGHNFVWSITQKL